MNHLFTNGLCPAAVAMAQAMPHRAPAELAERVAAMTDHEPVRLQRAETHDELLTPINCDGVPETERWLKVMMAVAEMHDVMLIDLASDSHEQYIVLARYEAAYRMRFELGMPYTSIGRRLNRHHGTIMYAVGTHALRYGLPCPDACAIVTATKSQRKKGIAA